MTSSGGRFDIRDPKGWRDDAEVEPIEVAYEPDKAGADPEDAPAPRSAASWDGSLGGLAALIRGWVFGPYAALRVTLLALTLLALAAGTLAGPAVQAYYLHDHPVGAVDVRADHARDAPEFSVTLVHRQGPPTIEALADDHVRIGADPYTGLVPVVTVSGFRTHEGTMRWIAPDGESERIWRDGRDLTPSNGLPYLGFPLDQPGTYRFDHKGAHEGTFDVDLELVMYQLRTQEDEFSTLQTKAGFMGAGLCGIGVIGVELLTRRS